MYLSVVKHTPWVHYVGALKVGHCIPEFDPDLHHLELYASVTKDISLRGGSLGNSVTIIRVSFV